MATREQAGATIRALIDMLEERRPRYRGLLGTSDGVIDVSSKPGYVYFREEGNPSKLRQIFNHKVPTLVDLPVIVGEDSNNPGIEQVLDIDIGVLPNWLGRTFLPDHHLTHELGGADAYGNRVDSDVVFVQKAQFVPLSLQTHDPADMSFRVEEDWYMYGDTQIYWEGGDTKTFSTPVTDGRAAYELVCIHGPTNALIYIRGSDFPIAAGVDETLIPNTPINCVAIGAVLLTHGDTTLTIDNIADTRVFLRASGGQISGSPHAHTSPLDGGWITDGLTITGDIQLGATNTVVTDVPGYGNGAYFHGGPVFSGSGYDSDNSDPLWIRRYNVSDNVSELRVNIGDDYVNPPVEDKFVVGVTDYSDGIWKPILDVGTDKTVGITGGTLAMHSGGFANGVKSIGSGDSPYSMGDDGILLCNTVLGNITVNLPEASTQKGLMYNIKNISTGEVIVDGNGTETIDDALTQTLTNLDKMRIASDGVSSWWIIAN